MLPGPGVKPIIIYIGEGYATCCSILQAADNPAVAVVIAFSANNMEPTAKAVHKVYPDVPTVVCGDDDWLTKGNPGLSAALKAATAAGAKVAIPRFMERAEADGKTKTDFNDLARCEGLNVVRAQLLAAKTPAEIEATFAQEAKATNETKLRAEFTAVARPVIEVAGKLRETIKEIANREKTSEFDKKERSPPRSSKSFCAMASIAAPPTTGCLTTIHGIAVYGRSCARMVESLAIGFQS